MKPMSERNLGMNKSGVDSDGYFPDAVKHKVLPRAGEIRGFKYPDTEEAAHSETNKAIKEVSANLPKPTFRH